MALGPNLIFGRPPVILPVKPHPCARTQPPAPFRKTVSVKLRFARPYWNKPVFSRPVRCGSRPVVTRRLRVGGVGEVGSLHPEYGDCTTVDWYYQHGAASASSQAYGYDEVSGHVRRRSAACTPGGFDMTGGSWRPAAERRSAEAVCVGHDYIPRTLVTGGRRDNAGRRGQSLEAPLCSSLGDSGRCQDSGSDGYWIITGRPRHRRERRSARVRTLGLCPAAPRVVSPGPHTTVCATGPSRPLVRE